MIFWLVLKLEISYRVIIELFLKVRQTQRQNPEFGHTQGEIQKTLQTSTVAFKGG